MYADVVSYMTYMMMSDPGCLMYDMNQNPGVFRGGYAGSRWPCVLGALGSCPAKLSSD